MKTGHCPRTNTKFSYLYRDAGNNKSHASVVFAGAFRPGDIERLRQVLDSATYFIAEQVGVPVAYLFEYGYEFDDEVDHCYHEFDDLELTEEQPTDARTIEEFVTRVEREAASGWNVPDSWFLHSRCE